MFKALLKNEDCLITHFDENLLTELIHNVSSSFVLWFDSISFVMFAFVSLFFVSILFASSLNASRFRRKSSWIILICAQKEKSIDKRSLRLHVIIEMTRKSEESALHRKCKKNWTFFERIVLFKSTNMQKAYKSIETAVWIIVDWELRRNEKSALRIFEVRWKNWDL
jgi:hypothetical protein